MNNIIKSSIIMTFIKQLPTISPKNKGSLKPTKQDHDKKIDHSFEATLKSLNLHQAPRKKEVKVSDEVIAKEQLNFTPKKNRLEGEDVKKVSKSNLKKKEKKENTESENMIPVDITVFNQQLSSKPKPVTTDIIKTAILDHKPNIKLVNDKLPSKNLSASSKTDARHQASTFITDGKQPDLHIALAEKKNSVSESLDLNGKHKIDLSFHYDDLNGFFQKSPQSESSPTVELNPKNLVLFNNKPITEKEWGSELSRIISKNIKDIKQLEIIVHPRHLGPIKILIEEANGKNKISIVAKDAYVATLIGEHVNNIHTKLLNSGESIVSINVINDSKLNDSNQDHKNQHGNKEPHQQLDFGPTNNNIETKKESSKSSTGIFA
ncbi:flagellar hook-length control protein FliK [Photobacterium kishitanii]|uniref:flagellar hook-length control protein FliK n=1 Tax=Photobacterium kishitanii TaxID=318456 RepID=UPI0011B1CA1E|nr:flagellar hook-length control protein FliK [Photobacterium kishitanii]